MLGLLRYIQHDNTFTQEVKKTDKSFESCGTSDSRHQLYEYAIASPY